MAMEDEIRILKEQIHKLILTNETLKLAKGGVEDKKSPGKKSSSKSSSSKLSKTTIHQNLEYLQKLANSLTETIAEKEIALGNQRNINKELGKRINELEEVLKETLPDKSSKMSIDIIEEITSAKVHSPTNNQITFNFKD